MELFCGCNSKWETGRLSRPIYKINFQLTMDKTRHGNPYHKYCEKCQFYYWIDPQHENQMFDLKRMNEMFDLKRMNEM